MSYSRTDSQILDWVLRRSEESRIPDTLTSLLVRFRADFPDVVLGQKRLRRIRSIQPNTVLLSCASMCPTSRDGLRDLMTMTSIPDVHTPRGLEEIAASLSSPEATLLGLIYDSDPNVIGWYYEFYSAGCGSIGSTLNSTVTDALRIPVYGDVIVVKNGPGLKCLEQGVDSITAHSLASEEGRSAPLTDGDSGPSEEEVRAFVAETAPTLTANELLIEAVDKRCVDIIVTLSKFKYTDSVKTLADTMTAEELYRGALLNKWAYKNVANYMEETAPRYALLPIPGNRNVRSRDYFSRVPLEIACIIIGEHLLLLERGHFAATSTRNRALVGIVLTQEVSKVLAKQGLNYSMVRLMQTATGTLMSGSLIPYLAQANDNKFDINDIDFYAGRGKGFDVHRFLQSGGIHRIWSLERRKGGRKLNIIESVSDNARDAIFYFHSTPVIGTLDANSYWDLVERHQRVWSVLHKYTDRGFTFVADYDRPHACGVDWNCPAVAPPHNTAWTLGGTVCSSHPANTTGSRPLKSSSAFENDVWWATVSAFIAAQEEPQDVIWPNNMPTLLPVLPARATTFLVEMEWGLINYARHMINIAIPSYPRLQAAWLFPDGTRVRRRVWVRVPVIRGFKRAASAVEMDTNLFMNSTRSGPRYNSFDIGKSSICIDRFPFDEPVDLVHSFTVIVCPQHVEGVDVHPINHLITELIPDLAHPWRGNVLVFKHGSTASKNIINISEADGTFLRTLSVFANLIALKTFRLLAAPETPPTPSLTFAGIGELIGEAISHLDIVGLSHYALLSKSHSFHASSILKHRVEQYMKPFFISDSAHTCFFHTLETTCSWIVKDVPFAVLSLPTNPDVPDNLHVIARPACEHFWAHIMLQVLGYTLLETRRPDETQAHVGDRVMVFSHNELGARTITITTSIEDHFFHLYFATIHMGEMSVISAHEIITPYVGMAAKRTIINVGPEPDIMPTSPFPQLVTYTMDTRYWTGPCGLSCPSLWRSTLGLRGFGHWYWCGVDDQYRGETDAILQEMGTMDIKWRVNFSNRCRNRKCIGLGSGWVFERRAANHTGHHGDQSGLLPHFINDLNALHSNSCLAGDPATYRIYGVATPLTPYDLNVYGTWAFIEPPHVLPSFAMSQLTEDDTYVPAQSETQAAWLLRDSGVELGAVAGLDLEDLNAIYRAHTEDDVAAPQIPLTAVVLHSSPSFEDVEVSYRRQADIVFTIGKSTYDDGIKALAATMSCHELYRTSLLNRRAYRNISQYMEELCSRHAIIPAAAKKSGLTMHSDDHFARLPVEVAALIIGDELALLDRVQFASTSSRNRALVGIIVTREIARILARRGLRYPMIRLMQTATGTLLSGSIIPLLADSVGFNIDDIDFYVGLGKGNDVQRFLLMAADYTLSIASEDYDDMEGINHVWALKQVDGRAKLNVVEAVSPNPLDAVLCFHCTAVMGAVEANGYWAAYPKLLQDHKALTTRVQMPICDTLDSHQHVWTVVRKYTDRGFTFIPEYDAPHICGQDKNCPGTWRISTDGGCTTIHLPSLPFVSVAPAHTSAWTLGGTVCANNPSNTLSNIRAVLATEDANDGAVSEDESDDDPSNLGSNDDTALPNFHPTTAGPPGMAFLDAENGVLEDIDKRVIQILATFTKPHYDDNTKKLASSMSAGELYRCAFMNRWAFKHVCTYMDHVSPRNAVLPLAGTTPGTISSLNDYFSRIPLEIATIILGENLALLDRVHFAATSTRNRALVGLVLSQNIAAILAKQGLRYAMIRLMQTVTGTLIAGPTIPILAGTDTLDPSEVVFFAGRGKGFEVQRFLRMAGRFTAAESNEDFNLLENIHRIWILDSEIGDGRITVVESVSDNPLDAVLSLHSTPVLGALDVSTYWVGYPRLLQDHKALTTAKQFLIHPSLQRHRQVWRIVHEYTATGFSFIFEYDEPHTCGIDLNCPGTLRSTADGGCATVYLPRFPFAHIPLQYDTAWSLGGTVVDFSPARIGQISFGITAPDPAYEDSQVLYDAQLCDLLDTVGPGFSNCLDDATAATSFMPTILTRKLSGPTTCHMLHFRCWSHHCRFVRADGTLIAGTTRNDEKILAAGDCVLVTATVELLQPCPVTGRPLYTLLATEVRHFASPGKFPL
ncbi:hypothetical protein C8J57DRAFT_1510990 [Mycena rebaudengoi]|nr:hypothetical protein C8J57DRAFT_1510990 [Mycena rebaudengoi]